MKKKGEYKSIRMEFKTQRNLQKSVEIKKGELKEYG